MAAATRNHYALLYTLGPLTSVHLHLLWLRSPLCCNLQDYFQCVPLVSKAPTRVGSSRYPESGWVKPNSTLGYKFRVLDKGKLSKTTDMSP